MNELCVQRVSRHPDIPADADLQTWIDLTLKQQQRSGNVTIRIVDRQESRDLNQRYRGQDKPTNVLSFPADLPPELALPDLGDLLICAPLVSAEAREQGKPVQQHWTHLVIHGCLHLLGYDHQAADEAEHMEALERTLLSRLGIPDPYNRD